MKKYETNMFMYKHICLKENSPHPCWRPRVSEPTFNLRMLTHGSKMFQGKHLKDILKVVEAAYIACARYNL